jgi:hypothetical protein
MIFHETKHVAVDIMTEPRGITCWVYDYHLHVCEPVAKQRGLLKALKTEMPSVIPLELQNSHAVTTNMAVADNSWLYPKRSRLLMIANVSIRHIRQCPDMVFGYFFERLFGCVS